VQRDGEVSLSLGFLVCLPLFAAYELALAALGPSAGRNAAELLACSALELLPGDTAIWRAGALSLAALLALRQVAREEPGALQEVRVLLLQGALAALAFGPLLVLFLAATDVQAAELGPRWSAPAGPGTPASPASVGVLLGAAAWEELVFRVGLLGILTLAVSRVCAFLGLPLGLARMLADLVAILGSSLAFAALHLEPLLRFLGAGGEAFDPPVFLWRTLAGLLLAGLFRWRGLAVAAWAHGLFNLALLLGAGPGVLLAPS
jgi:membrane protease YdiL (CAAX protease family)